MRAIRLRNEYMNGIHELLAPDIYLAEIANGLVSAERQGRIKTGESALLLHAVLGATPAIHPTSSLLLQAMAVALATRRAVYDCVYLALAEAERCGFVTPMTNLPAACGRPFLSSSRWRRCLDMWE